jgi:hypothetical protein
VYYAIEVPKYRRLPPFARTRAWSRALTYWTLADECALGTLVWIRELRLPVRVSGVLLHVGMEAFMNVYLFGAVMIVCLTLFLQPEEARWLLSVLRLV